jgi:hypothetical protein
MVKASYEKLIEAKKMTLNQVCTEQTPATIASVAQNPKTVRVSPSDDIHAAIQDHASRNVAE